MSSFLANISQLTQPESSLIPSLTPNLKKIANETAALKSSLPGLPACTSPNPPIDPDNPGSLNYTHPSAQEQLKKLLHHPDLNKVAKFHHVKCVGSNEEIIERILAFYKA